MSYLLQIISAFWLGALHSLEPGHGKGVMGTYLVLSRGRPIHVVILGLSSALSHTLVVVLLAVTAHAAAATLQSAPVDANEQVKLWLHLVTGVLIVFIGYRLIPKHNKSSCCSHGHHHNHHHPSPRTGSLKIFDLLILGLTNGLIPCPGALAVLLLSLNTGTLGAGLIVVFAFGAGAALALIIVGMLFIKMSFLTGKIAGERTWTRLAAAAGIVVMGVGVFAALKAAQSIYIG